jgi:hypothetical protein
VGIIVRLRLQAVGQAEETEQMMDLRHRRRVDRISVILVVRRWMMGGCRHRLLHRIAVRVDQMVMTTGHRRHSSNASKKCMFLSCLITKDGPLIATYMKF